MSFLSLVKERKVLWFETTVVVFIIISSILLGLETFPELYNGNYQFFNSVDLIILGVFVVELLIRIIAEGRHPLNYFKSAWNVFDFVIVVVTILPHVFQPDSISSDPLLALRIFRLLRAGRVLRTFLMVDKVPSLKLIVETMMRTIPALISVLLLLAVWFYVYAIIGTFLFGSCNVVKFATLSDSVIALFECMLGNWVEIMETILQSPECVVSPVFIYIYFISFYMVGGLIILNLIIGVIVSELQEGKILLERKMMRDSFADDVSDQVNASMSELEEQISNINSVFKKLQVSLDKNQSGG